MRYEIFVRSPPPPPHFVHLTISSSSQLLTAPTSSAIPVSQHSPTPTNQTKSPIRRRPPSFADITLPPSPPPLTSHQLRHPSLPPLADLHQPPPTKFSISHLLPPFVNITLPGHRLHQLKPPSDAPLPLANIALHFSGLPKSAIQQDQHPHWPASTYNPLVYHQRHPPSAIHHPHWPELPYLHLLT